MKAIPLMELTSGFLELILHLNTLDCNMSTMTFVMSSDSQLDLHHVFACLLCIIPKFPPVYRMYTKHFYVPAVLLLYLLVNLMKSALLPDPRTQSS